MMDIDLNELARASLEHISSLEHIEGHTNAEHISIERIIEKTRSSLDIIESNDTSWIEKETALMSAYKLINALAARLEVDINKFISVAPKIET
jgi:hypothetical protein